MIQPGVIDFQGVDVNQVLEVYSKLVGRTLLHGQVPPANIVLRTETPLTKTETIQALQAVLALNGIAVVNIGDKFVKVGPVTEANTYGAELDNTPAASLPNLGSYITHIVQLQWVKPTVMAPIIQPFAKLQGGIIPLDDNGILVLRDYAENVKRMLEMIAKIDVSVPAEYVSEVIPIKYALAADIANALNSLGGSGGGGNVSFGGSSGAAPISGFQGGATRTGGGLGAMNGMSGNGQPGGASGTFGQRPTTTSPATPNGTPAAAGTTFQQRLNAIINKASGPGPAGQDQIQVFGQTKIIADSRANALLVFATRQDMVAIKKVISQLDVLLSQVLIEAIIMDVSLGKQLNLGVSVAQNPQQLGNSSVIGGGGFNNGQTFLGTIANLVTNFDSTGTNILSIGKTVTSSFGTNGASFGNSLPGGFSYFGNIGPSWDVALQAAESDNTANIIQRPRIQTSQAKQAQFFVGQTVPYVTGTYYNGGYGGGNSSQYSQLSVGIELDVTPFINPEGLVVMDINQEIDDVAGYTSIDGNQVPNTDKRTLSSEIAVRDRDTIILGGFIRTDKSHAQSGVPFLQNIPILGNLFSSRTDKKDREELIVLMRPTVMKTLDEVAAVTENEKRRLPGVSQAAYEESVNERKLTDAQRKRELRYNRGTTNYDGFFTRPPVLVTPPGQNDGTLNTLPPATILDQPQPQIPAPATVPAPAPAVNPAVTAKPVVVTPAQPPPAGPDNGFFSTPRRPSDYFPGGAFVGLARNSSLGSSDSKLRMGWSGIIRIFGT